MKDAKELIHRFHEILEQHKGILFKVVRAYCRDEDDRQDLFQEIIIQIWRSLPKYSNKYKMTTWVYRISLNVAISYYRKNAGRKARNIPLNEQIYQIQEVDNSEKEDQLNYLEQFISELNDLDKALMLLYLEDKNQAEIADIIGSTVSNVSTRVGRIKEKLRKRFLHINL